MDKAEWVLIKTIEQKVIKFIEEHEILHKGEKLLIALSGGPDSVFALNFFHKYRSRFGISLASAHVNHGLRGMDSEMDEKFCAELSANYGVQYFAEKIDVKGLAKLKKVSVEEAARELRYRALEAILRQNHFDKIVTAHNLNDNAETVLLNLIKGTGLKGISGIPVKRGDIIRPLLGLSKPEILKYLELNKIGFRTDITNLSSIYERNFIRNELLPEIRAKLNPSVDQSLFNSSENFRNAQIILEEHVSTIMNRIVEFSNKSIIIDIENFRHYNPALLGELLKASIGKYFKKEFSFRDLKKLSSLLSKQPGRKESLTGGLRGIKERGRLVIREEITEEEFLPLVLKAGEEISFKGRKLRIKLKDLVSPYVQEVKSSAFHEFISGELLDEEFTLRRWKPGDRFVPLGMKGFKKLSDFLSEQKIAVEEKKKQLVLLNRNNIIWVPGYRIDDRYKLTKNIKRICELCLE
ncbi:MAG: tRNA lysidine(34) synthetase TilS [Ignavibacteria bacterium]|jgi:tRNA(Ile)-lysidine synthase|nr:tRNA lysidine(34) synthetase TilS [Ignavibacteria bacterium]MCU7502808.1 tRNA lysidine(34) synthetase TilS [Ignavibacteria bacterium]MCU7517912.1 tRNA lysidine(34) synthetase TilS [Ignavibacteria bacterium]